MPYEKCTETRYRKPLVSSVLLVLSLTSGKLPEDQNKIILIYFKHLLNYMLYCMSHYMFFSLLVAVSARLLKQRVCECPYQSRQSRMNRETWVSGNAGSLRLLMNNWSRDGSIKSWYYFMMFVKSSLINFVDTLYVISLKRNKASEK